MRVLALLLLLSSLSSAQRLPRIAVPEHYSLAIDPDLRSGTLSGHEEIEVRLKDQSKKIWLNSIGLRLKNVMIRHGKETLAGIVTADEAKEMVELAFPRQIPAGAAFLSFDYAGRIRDDLKGFYLSRTPRRIYAVTQFEGTYARMMFPSFDEPEYKATFDLSVVVDQDDTAISNGAIASDTPATSPGRHTLRFARSPRMSTYLLALAIGDWHCVEGRADEIPIRICTLPEKQRLTRFALHAAESFMHFYNRYYAIKYPFKKLDMVAIPDYEWGGMENTAAVFYKERALLVDDETAAVEDRRGVASVVAHEMAHQWFGDLVTMKWWNDVWLNEGFATWMTPKALSSWDPKWDQRTEIAEDKAFVLRMDARRSTRPIRAKGETPAEIKQLFDGIAYAKGAAVLHMIEAYLGEKTFKNGINSYLARYANSNATSEDFWRELEKASGKPVGRIMQSFVDRPGVPLVSVRCQGEKCGIAQEQYQACRKARRDAGRWAIPLCMRPLAEASTRCEILQKPRREIPAPGGTFLVNAGAQGYYRTAHSLEQVNEFRKKWRALQAAERISLLDDQWALVRIGRVDVDDFLSLAETLQGETDRVVVSSLLPHLLEVSRLLDDEQRKIYNEWQAHQIAPLAERLRTEAADSDDQRSLRAVIFRQQTTVGVASALAKAKEITARFLQEPASVEPDLASVALRAAAQDGNADLYGELVTRTQTAKTPDLYFRFLMALTYFQDSALIERSLAMLISPSMREQDVPAFLAGLLRNPAARDRAWSFLKEHWPQLKAKIVSFGGSAPISALGEYCSADKQRDVQDFFSSHSLPGAERSIRGAVEEISSCAELRDLQHRQLARWLSAQSYAR